MAKTNTDCYFTKTRQTLAHRNINPYVIQQVFQKKNGIMCGGKWVEEFFRGQPCELYLLPDGEELQPFEPVMYVKGPAQTIVEYETLYLGKLARSTRIATNVHNAVCVANGKPVLFFPARFEDHSVQVMDGYAAAVGGAAGCSTEKQMLGWATRTGKSNKPTGTMPHFLIACFGGDVVEASLATYEAHPDEDVYALVDFNNDCVGASVRVYNAFVAKGYKLAGVRLDTSENMKDVSLASLPGSEFKGVNPSLVFNVRNALDNCGGKDVKICVSGGFTPEKIQRFEQKNTPVDVYAVGEYFLSGSHPFTSDIVAVQESMIEWKPIAKAGRQFLHTDRLVRVF